MTETEASKPLDYAPPPPMHQRRGFRRALFALLALVLVIVLVPLIARGIQHARLLYWQGQCMNATLPPESPVWSIDVQSKPNAHQAWSRFYALLSPPGGAHWPTAFLHSRDAGQGKRLVVVDLAFHPNDRGGGATHSRAFVPGTVTRRPLEVGGAYERLTLHKPAALFFAGQPDPADPSHFTIDYISADGQRHTLDGWLLPDDRVVIEPRVEGQ